ncbi:Protein Networked (NET), actin-binding (NAB) domain containing protein [Trema orientale]|uniref:Protein Networked (NET), actin-binding (NAB) domain containing protein n=1 Tax=Trema orientale TaxID=63057 RepID=A0A2P5BIJ7_TREOI|nr:Protein Networked (NET), actin-binding (NAB) domain containing protein [Trema orientale]
MENIESNFPGSSWEINPNSSKWLAENLKEMDQSVRRMLTLIEEDGSLTMNVEMYFQRKSELLANVKEFHQLYRTLAERYDHMTKELCKSIPSDLQLQGSGNSESSYEQDSPLLTPDVKVGLPKSGHQAAGLDTSPSSPGAGSVFSLKEGNESSSLSSSDSESESFVNNYLRTPLSINSQSLQQKTIELETELSNLNDKLQTREADLELERKRVLDLQGQIFELETHVSNTDYKSGMLEEELEVTRNMLKGSDKEIANLRHVLNERETEGHQLQNQLELAREDIATFEARLDSERRHVSELQERIVRYNADVSDRDLKVSELKAALHDAEKQFSMEKAQLQSDVSSLSEKQVLLGLRLKECELRTKELEDKILLSEAEKIEMQRFHVAEEMALKNENNQLKVELSERREHVEVLNKEFDKFKLKYDMLMAEKDGLIARVDTLMANVSARDNQIQEIERYLSQLRKKQEELIDESQSAQRLIDELKLRMDELQNEVDRQRIVISDGAEEKREAIRQLCFSLEHYRSGYQELRQAIIGHRRNVVMAA